MSEGEQGAHESVVRAARERGYEVEVLGPHAVRAQGRFGEPTLAALELLQGSDGPVGVWTDGLDGGRSALCLWSSPDLYAITLGEGGRWEHFRAAAGLGALRDSWRGGGRGRFRVPHGPLMRPIPEAVELAESWGFETPTTWQPVPPPRPATPAAAPVSSRERAARPRATSTSSRPVRPEPVEKICPRCFTALPATGVCGYCA